MTLSATSWLQLAPRSPDQAQLTLAVDSSSNDILLVYINYIYCSSAGMEVGREEAVGDGGSASW